LVFLLFLSQEYTRLTATVEAGDYDVRLSFLLYAHAAIIAWHEQRVAVFADVAFKRDWQAYSCGHGYFSSGLYVAARQLRVSAVSFLGLLKEHLNTLFGYLFCGGVHL
jgi:hypothetical protein